MAVLFRMNLNKGSFLINFYNFLFRININNVYEQKNLRFIQIKKAPIYGAFKKNVDFLFLWSGRPCTKML